VKAQIIAWKLDPEAPDDELNTGHGILFPERRVMVAIRMSDPDVGCQYALHTEWTGDATHYRVLKELDGDTAQIIFTIASEIHARELDLCKRLEAVYWRDIFAPPPPDVPGEFAGDDDPTIPF
jgi:hypothetical protein